MLEEEGRTGWVSRGLERRWGARVVSSRTTNYLECTQWEKGRGEMRVKGTRRIEIDRELDFIMLCMTVLQPL